MLARCYTYTRDSILAASHINADCAVCYHGGRLGVLAIGVTCLSLKNMLNVLCGKCFVGLAPRMLEIGWLQVADRFSPPIHPDEVVPRSADARMDHREEGGSFEPFSCRAAATATG